MNIPKIMFFNILKVSAATPSPAILDALAILPVLLPVLLPVALVLSFAVVDAWVPVDATTIDKLWVLDSVVIDAEGVEDDIATTTSLVDAAWVVDSTVCVGEFVCFEEGLADVQGGGGVPGGGAGPEGAHGVHSGEGLDGAAGGPDGVGSHRLMLVVEVEQQIALDRLARGRERNA